MIAAIALGKSELLQNVFESKIIEVTQKYCLLFLDSALTVHFVLGPLMGGPQCRLSILRNGNVPCHYFSNFPVDF